MIDRKFLPFSGSACCGNKKSDSSPSKGGCGCSENNQTLSESSNAIPIKGTSWGPGVSYFSRALSLSFDGIGVNDVNPPTWVNCNSAICCNYYYDWNPVTKKWVLHMTCWRRAGQGVPEWRYNIES